MTPNRVTATFWRCWLVRVAFRLPHTGWPSRLCWRLSRAWATENTHAALVAYSSSLLMNGIMTGEL